MELFITILHFIIGLVLLIKGGDWFVDGAAGIAKKFHLPELLIGATIVSIGTTLPEVMVSATSAVTGHSEIAYGNAIGSVICNTALISAVTAAVMPSKVDKKTFTTPVFFFFGAAIFYAVVSYTTGMFERWMGIVLLVAFVAYIVLNARNAVKNKTSEEDSEENLEIPKEKDKPFWLLLVLLLVGAGFIAVGANFLVHYGTNLAVFMGVPESVIALTFVALGTSLPELVTAVTALIKKHSDLSLGNIVGANFFNLALVSGLSITLSPFNIPVSSTINGISTSLIVDIPLMFVVMALLTIPTIFAGKLKRYQGITLLLLYAAYMVFQFVF